MIDAPVVTRSALFVDFDNVYLGLREIDKRAAEVFATNPGRWLAWLQQGMPSIGDQPAFGAPRSVLVRNVYLNPRTFGQYRPDFVRSAFTVTDCPPLTQQGKTAADIRMAMDVLDALAHPTQFDEFIILSGDADFTPVLLRLRTHDRRTVVFSAGKAAHAYKAACDFIVSEDLFIEAALGLATDGRAGQQPGPVAEPAARSDDLLDRMGQDLLRCVETEGTLEAVRLPAIYRKFDTFVKSGDWLGYGGLRPLTQAIIDRRPQLRINDRNDTWSVEWFLVDAPAATGDMTTTRWIPAYESQRQEVVSLIRHMVETSAEPIVMARAAQLALRRFPDLVRLTWLGHGTFANLLLSAENRGFEVYTRSSPGYVYDPMRHVLPADHVDRRVESLGPDLAELAGRVNRLTGTPILSAEEYASVFQAISDHLSTEPYHLTTTSKGVRDLCIERGHPVPRISVSFVLKGLAYSGSRLGDDVIADAPDALAEQYFDNVLRLCANSDLALSGEECNLLRRWIAPNTAEI